MAGWQRSRAAAQISFVATLLLATPVGAWFQEPGKEAAKPSGSAAGTLAGLTRETLNYAVEWRLIPAGMAKLTYTPLPHSAGEVRLQLESAGLVSRLFHVNDDYTAMLGQNFCAQSSFMAAHEGNRSRETRVVYDGPGHKASYVEKDLTKNLITTHDVDIPLCVHDVLGGLLVLRSLNLEPGKTAQVPLSDGKKFVQAKIESQRREELKTDFGVVKTIRYEVFLFDNVLYKRPGHLHVWLTDDDRHLPVELQVRFQFTIGTITFRLQKDPPKEEKP